MIRIPKILEISNGGGNNNKLFPPLPPVAANPELFGSYSGQLIAKLIADKHVPSIHLPNRCRSYFPIRLAKDFVFYPQNSRAKEWLIISTQAATGDIVISCVDRVSGRNSENYANRRNNSQWRAFVAFPFQMLATTTLSSGV